jgi:hypothetical protein
MSMKNSNDTIRNQTRDLPACSAVRNDRMIKELRTGNCIEGSTGGCLKCHIGMYEYLAELSTTTTN